MRVPTKWLIGLQINAALSGAMVVFAHYGKWGNAFIFFVLVSALTAFLATEYPFTDNDNDGTDAYC